MLINEDFFDDNDLTVDTDTDFNDIDTDEDKIYNFAFDFVLDAGISYIKHEELEYYVTKFIPSYKRILEYSFRIMSFVNNFETVVKLQTNNEQTGKLDSIEFPGGLSMEELDELRKKISYKIKNVFIIEVKFSPDRRTAYKKFCSEMYRLFKTCVFQNNGDALTDVVFVNLEDSEQKDSVTLSAKSKRQFWREEQLHKIYMEMMNESEDVPMLGDTYSRYKDMSQKVHYLVYLKNIHNYARTNDFDYEIYGVTWTRGNPKSVDVYLIVRPKEGDTSRYDTGRILDFAYRYLVGGLSIDDKENLQDEAFKEFHLTVRILTDNDVKTSRSKLTGKVIDRNSDRTVDRVYSTYRENKNANDYYPTCKVSTYQFLFVNDDWTIPQEKIANLTDFAYKAKSAKLSFSRFKP